MELFIGADHQGFELKNELTAWLKAAGHTVTDVGADSFDKDDDYPDYGHAVAVKVAEDVANRRGIVLCGSGVGMAVVADKVPGIRAALIHDADIARAARRDDDINVLAIGAAFIAPNKAKEVVEAWLATPFSGLERHARRIGKIAEYEKH